MYLCYINLTDSLQLTQFFKKQNLTEVLITFSLFISDVRFLDCSPHTSVNKVPHATSGSTHVNKPFKMNSH